MNGSNLYADNILSSFWIVILFWNVNTFCG